MAHRIAKAAAVLIVAVVFPTAAIENTCIDSKAGESIQSNCDTSEYGEVATQIIFEVIRI